MKNRIKILSILFLAFGYTAVSNNANAQVRVRVNIGTPAPLFPIAPIPPRANVFFHEPEATPYYGYRRDDAYRYNQNQYGGWSNRGQNNYYHHDRDEHHDRDRDRDRNYNDNRNMGNRDHDRR